MAEDEEVAAREAQAARLRDRARQARRLALAIADEHARRELEKHAEELERQAQELVTPPRP